MKFDEPGRASLDQIAKTLRPLAFPTRFAVEVTADCNLACSMCHHPDMRRPKGSGKDKGRILNIKYSAGNRGWHYKGQISKKKG